MKEDKYKNAWEELKSKFADKESGYDKHDLNLTQEVEKKHGIEVE